METTQSRQITVQGKIRHGKLVVSKKLALPNGDVNVTVSLPRFKGRRVYTVEEVAQTDNPFPDESEWVEEILRNHRKRKKA